MNKQELAHKWANNKGLSKRCGNVSAEGKAFYSYGTVIARYVESKLGNFYILNVTGYSSSSSSHLTCVRRALNGHSEPIFEIGGLSRGDNLMRHEIIAVIAKDLIKWQSDVMHDNMVASAKARGRAVYFRERALCNMREINRISAFLHPRRKPVFSEADFGNIDQMITKAAKQSKAEEEQRIKAQKEREAKWAEERRLAEIKHAEALEEGKLKLQEWLNGGEHFQIFHELPIVCRTRAKKTLIETSNQAVIPYEAGRLVFDMFMNQRILIGDDGMTPAIGDYRIKEISQDHVVIGCTTIMREEIERFAKQEGWA